MLAVAFHIVGFAGVATLLSPMQVAIIFNRLIFRDYELPARDAMSRIRGAQAIENGPLSGGQSWSGQRDAPMNYRPRP